MWLLVAPLVVGVVLWVTGYLSARDKLPRNTWAGIRMRVTLVNDETWFAAHRAAAPWLTGGGYVEIAAALLIVGARYAGWVTLATARFAAAMLIFAGFVPFTIGAIKGQAAARRALK